MQPKPNTVIWVGLMILLINVFLGGAMAVYGRETTNYPYMIIGLVVLGVGLWCIVELFRNNIGDK